MKPALWAAYSGRLRDTAERMSRAASVAELKAVIAENEDLWAALDADLAGTLAQEADALWVEALCDRARYVKETSRTPALSDASIASFIALNRQVAETLTDHYPVSGTVVPPEPSNTRKS